MYAQEHRCGFGVGGGWQTVLRAADQNFKWSVEMRRNELIAWYQWLRIRKQRIISLGSCLWRVNNAADRWDFKRKSCVFMSGGSADSLGWKAQQVCAAVTEEGLTDVVPFSSDLTGGLYYWLSDVFGSTEIPKGWQLMRRLLQFCILIYYEMKIDVSSYLKITFIEVSLPCTAVIFHIQNRCTESTF